MLMLPDTFVDMPSSIVKLKYPSEQRPQIIKTSLDASVNFTFSLFNQEFEDSQVGRGIEQCMEFLIAGIGRSWIGSRLYIKY